jgi:hypothetical protein
MSSDATAEAAAPEPSFHAAAHVKYFQKMLQLMPEPYSEIDTSRMTAIYFSVVGLDILGSLDSIDKVQIVEFVYSLQLRPSPQQQRHSSGQFGFIGGNFMNHSLCGFCNPSTEDGASSSGGSGTAPTATCFCGGTQGERGTGDGSNSNDGNSYGSSNDSSNGVGLISPHSCALSSYHQGHIAMTYTALATLATLGDGLQRVDRQSILAGSPMPLLSVPPLLPHPSLQVPTLTFSPPRPSVTPVFL